MRAPDLDHCQIRLWVGADDVGTHGLTVRKVDVYRCRARCIAERDNVVVGQNMTLRVQYHASTDSLLLCLALPRAAKDASGSSAGPSEWP